MASKWAWRTTSRAAGRSLGAVGCPAPARSSAVWVRARSPRACGPAGVERRVGAEGLQRRGAVGEGPVEVEGVGDVELGLEPHRAGEVHVVVVDRGVARVDVEVAVLRIRGRVDVGEVVALDRLGDEPVQLRRHRSDRRPRRPGRPRTPQPPGSARASVWMVTSATERARHAGTASGLDLRPQPREAVAQLEGVTDELLRRGRRDPEDGAELGEAELRHQRRTLTRDRLLVLTTRDGERRGVVDRLRRVQVGPPGSQRPGGRRLRGPRRPCGRGRARAGRER